MKAITLHRHEIKLHPESARVIIRPFIPTSRHGIQTIIGRALALTEEEATQELNAMHQEFDARHLDIEAVLLQNYEKVQVYVFTQRPMSRVRKLLIGAYFSGEYALESAALFNPSMVPHPSQKGVPKGSQRFIMSLRATGEGHISSIEFRSGIIDSEGAISIDKISRYVSMPEVVPNPSYLKKSVIYKLHEMGFYNDYLTAILDPLEDEFNRNDLDKSISAVRHASRPLTHEFIRTLECIQWLVDSNNELLFSPQLNLSERIIFPVMQAETHGIEDARFVRFVNDDGSVMYFATYTAYNGRAILPMMIETEDFLEFRMLTLNGNAVQNKGMALFPRLIDGRYAMLSRQDDENLMIMYSDNPHYWNDPQILMRPSEPWESVKVGNCGSPIETEEGWLVITHGVGPMRKYCIGAALLDLKDPAKMIGRLRYPLLCPVGEEREGYVPNVVYSCGSMLHGKQLILPYAISDRATAIATVPLDELLAALRNSDR